MPDIAIRPARPADADRLQELNRVALRQVDAYVEGVADSDLDDVVSHYDGDGGAFLVGEVDGDVVAMGGLQPADGGVWTDRALRSDDGPAAEITRMRVDPDHQRRGYGSRLLDALEAQARESGFEVLVLDTTARQTGARALYESTGYERVEAFEWRTYEVLLYRKELSD